MRELSPQRMSEDGRFLIARDDHSQELFALRAGHRLASLIDASGLRKHNAGQLEITMESSLSPRDIQTRIRRGESPEGVAESAGVPVEQIIGFATPVLAEREYMAEQARKATIRRQHVDSAVLGTVVDDTIIERGGVPEDGTWDSWRREDGRWTVVVTPAGADSPATFLFDVQGRYVLAADAKAHDLAGDIAPSASPEMAIADAVSEAAAAQILTEPEVDHVAEALVEPAGDEDTPAAPVHSLKEVRDRKALEQLALGLDSDDAPAVQERTTTQRAELDEEAVNGSPKHKKAHERRRVPSWDEIMFGGSS